MRDLSPLTSDSLELVDDFIVEISDSRVERLFSAQQ